MAYSYDSGWVGQDNGTSRTINLLGRWVTSATIEFRGVDGSLSFNSVSDDLSLSHSPKDLSVPSTPSGTRFYRTRARSRCYAASGAPYAAVQLPGRSKVERSRSSVYSAVTAEDTTYTWKSGTARLEASQDGSGGWWEYYLGTSGYKQTQNPSATVNGVTTAHSGYLTTGGSTSGQKSFGGLLNGLADNKSNTINFASSNSEKCQVRIRYEWIEKPSIITQEPEEVGPESAILKADLTSIGNAETNRYFEYGITTSYELGSINAGVGGVGSFTAEVSGLGATETYYYRAYAVNAAGRTNGAQKSFTTIAIPPEVRTLIADDIEYTSVRFNGEILNLGGLPTDRWFEYSKHGDFSDSTSILVESAAGLGIYNYTETGLDFDTLYYYRAYGMNDAGRGNGTTRTLTTPYPYIYAPEIISPEFGHQQLDDKPTFEFTLTENPVNPATLYHARLRISQYVSINPTLQSLQSDGDNGTWQYYDGENWQDFPAEGVPPETTVRVTLNVGLGVGPWYWDCASIEADGEGRTGLNSDYRVIRILLDIEDRFYILLTGVSPNEYKWDVYNAMRILETSNGQLGYITFETSNKPFDDNGTETTANEVIDYGDRVLLAIKDWTGASEEFLGRVRQKEPHGDLLKVSAILADGILGERIIKTDYPDETNTIMAYSDNSTWLSITSIDDEGGKPKFTVSGHGMDDGDEVVIRNTDRYDRRWTVEDTTANTFIIDRDYDVEATLGECLPVDDAVLEVRSNLHGFTNGTRIIIKESDHYDGVHTVSNVATDTFEISAVYEDEDAVGRCGALEDIGVTVKKIIDNYCQGIEAIVDNVNLETGYIVPVSAEGKTAARVMEDIRRNYGLFYYVDKDAYLNLYKPEEIVSEPYPQMTIRRGDPIA